MKILTRLSKEGSSADEPLNIPLSDYSSDEGDSSSSSDDEGKDSMCDLEGPCCQPLRVPPSSPVLIAKKPPSEKKINKKIVRVSSSPKKRNKLLTRSVMDIPTTDPGSDFLDFTTEDECETDFENDGGGQQLQHHTPITKTTITRIPKLRTEPFIRKSSSISYEQSAMPPELIITKVSDDNQFNYSDLTAEGKIEETKNISFSHSIIKEFPPIGKKTKSWHNFNRCMSTMKIRNINCDTTYQTAESLHFKLSLKKQIWTGTQSDTNVMEISRPLSWGAQTSSSALLNKTFFYDSEALLTACSQKLAQWQENETMAHANVEKIKLNSISRNLQKISPRKAMKDELKVKYKSDQRSGSISDNSGIPKIKKKTRTTLNKLVETADIISNLAKNTKSSSAKIKKPLPTQIMDRSQNKFKTGGIVVTAVQNRKKPKEINLVVNTDTEDVENAKISLNKKFRHHTRAKENPRRIPSLNQ